MLMGVFLYSSQRMEGPDSWRERVCMCVAHLRAEARLTDTERRRAVKKKKKKKRPLERPLPALCTADAPRVSYIEGVPVSPFYLSSWGKGPRRMARVYWLVSRRVGPKRIPRHAVKRPEWLVHTPGPASVPKKEKSESRPSQPVMGRGSLDIAKHGR